METLKTKRGVNLLDLMIAMAMLVILATMGVEQLETLTEVSRLRSAGQILLSEVKRARGLAISHNLSVRLEFRLSPAGYALAPRGAALAWKPFPRGMELVGVPSRAIEFHSRGVAAPAGSIALANRAGSVRVIVSPAGRVRIEENYE